MSQSKYDGKHILILGSGSVGKRHAQNFQQLGCYISSVDPRQDRQEEMSSSVDKLVGTYESFELALASDVFDAVVICSPTSFHPEQSKKSFGFKASGFDGKACGDHVERSLGG